MKESNYARLCDMWRERFITWDHQAAFGKLGLEGFFEDHLEINYFGTAYWIDRLNGRVTNIKNPEQTIDFSTQMALYHLFYYSTDSPKNSGEWVPFRQVRGVGNFESAYIKLIEKPFEEAFNGRCDALKRIGKRLGFQALDHGDVSFLVLAFDCVPLKFIFWDGDDEFPAKFTMLFDKNITDFTHPETVVLLAEDGVRCFLEKTGQLKKSLQR